MSSNEVREVTGVKDDSQAAPVLVVFMNKDMAVVMLKESCRVSQFLQAEEGREGGGEGMLAQAY